MPVRSSARSTRPIARLLHAALRPSRRRALLALAAGVLAPVVPTTAPAQGTRGQTSGVAAPPRTAGWSAALARRFEGITLPPTMRGEVLRTHVMYQREIVRVRDSARASSALDAAALERRLAELAREEQATFRAILPLVTRAKFDENLAAVDDSARIARERQSARADTGRPRPTRRPPP